jgi:hypothetical protein
MAKLQSYHNRLLSTALLFACSFSGIDASEAYAMDSVQMDYPERKLTIVGGGIIGGMHALVSYLETQEDLFFAKPEKQRNQKLRITIFEKNKSVLETTSANICPSLTCDELLSVVPLGNDLVKALETPFNLPGGVKVSDVPGIDAPSAKKFKEEVLAYSQDPEGHKARVESLLELGKLGMDFWQRIYDKGDPKLKAIFENSNFNPCREPRIVGNKVLHDGYRIDLIYAIPNAKQKAQSMLESYNQLGYINCHVLSPDELVQLDPTLSTFSNAHSNNGKWNDDSVALWRPGGCLDVRIFLPELYAYLTEAMGTYVDSRGEVKNCFQLRLGREVTGVEYDPNLQVITGLKLGNYTKSDNHEYSSSDYIFCPGEAIGTLSRLEFQEPAHAAFAGASLQLNVLISREHLKEYEINHCMEVHQTGIVLAWQARLIKDKLIASLQVAGTKAFYASEKPENHHEFAKDRHLLQLNMLNDVLGKFLSLALGRNTVGVTLTQDDLNELENKGIANRWVGRRAVTYDGYPLYGYLYKGNQRVTNGFCTTYLGSGGISFALASVASTLAAKDDGQSMLDSKAKGLIPQILKYADSRRNAGK